LRWIAPDQLEGGPFVSGLSLVDWRGCRLELSIAAERLLNGATA
jgi:hypothetical protein